ncbi:MAG: bifunctional 2-polyprenyl-6-hydroxyphenol methylase/3-demethylubiquinol 3-O-methyltransferase UbiG [Thermodesulfobacteriota bacterium]
MRRFGAAAHAWWDPDGEFRALHDINPLRLDYVADRTHLKGRAVLDVGCGGGLLSEGLTARGAWVTGIDMASEAVAVAREHQRLGGFRNDYRRTSAEAHALENPGGYDVVACMELLEHVPDPGSLIRACASLVRPGGDVFFATINRNPLAGFLVIMMAEWVLGLVPKGTHHYAGFVRPEEIRRWGRGAGLGMKDLSGMFYNPFTRRGTLTRNASVNYLMHFQRVGDGPFENSQTFRAEGRIRQMMVAPFEEP